jgi:CheY-like chemotaxis protein
VACRASRFMRQPATRSVPARSRPRERARPVLVVDDDADMRTFVAETLSDDGFEVIAARDGGEALALVEDERPALLLLDIQMPGVNGIEVARELRMRLRQIPVVVMTAMPQAERQADRCNAVACLRKPFETGALIRLVRRFAR